MKKTLKGLAGKLVGKVAQAAAKVRELFLPPMPGGMLVPIRVRRPPRTPYGY